MDIREKLAKIARENINLFEDAGCGMYNLDIDISGIYDRRAVEGTPYNKLGIFQIYPYEESEFYGSIYVLAYYPYNDKGDCENDCYEPCDETLKEIYKRVKTELNGKYPMITDTKSLKPFVKATTLEEKVAIINDWEEDRGAESEEYIYDLDDNEGDAQAFRNMYGEHAFEVRRHKARFWTAGNAFYCDVADKTMFVSHEVYAVTANNIDTLLSDNNVLGEILDRLHEYLTANCNDVAMTAKDMNAYYHDRIDFNGYLDVNKKYRWIAVSNDHAFEDESEREFDTEKECYNDMRNHALEKMKWNTDYDNDLGDIVDGEDYIGYGVRFRRDKIMHFSYSGGYLYKIVPSKKFEYEDYEELAKEIEKLIDEEGIIL